MAKARSADDKQDGSYSGHTPEELAKLSMRIKTAKGMLGATRFRNLSTIAVALRHAAEKLESVGGQPELVAQSGKLRELSKEAQMNALTLFIFQMF